MSTTSYESNGDIAVVTLSNPPLNLFVASMAEGIDEAVRRATAEGRRAMVIKADGPVFCSGADVSQFQGLTSETGAELISRATKLLGALEDAPFPVIAAVHGMCLAAGIEVALACDLVIAAEDTKFAQVEAMIGATTLLGGVYRLAERCGPARAKEIVYTGDFYTAHQFQQWNIVNRVVPGPQLHEQALGWAQQLAAGPTRAHQATKRLVREFLEHGSRQTDRYLADIAPVLFETGDMRTAVDYLLRHGARKLAQSCDEIRFEGR
ncbi:enoyl-CoA hydratase/isomerase family protein [Nocardia sp. bgisy134]|uniref:enoyl-CoA hydratase/isomerase family protein n=1 Tax=Nocardia sp. bgisy134 TaxID=3413789 RepID=UPI003D716D1D